MKSARDLRKEMNIKTYDKISLLEELEHYMELAKNNNEREVRYLNDKYNRNVLIDTEIELERLGYQVSLSYEYNSRELLRISW